jgi:hypothetical protein
MKMIPKFVLITALLSSAVAARAAEPDAKTDAKAEAKTEPVKITQGTNGETILTLDAETQKRIGLEVASPAAIEWQPEIKAFGRVLDTAPLVELLTDFGRGLMTFDVSHQELERAKQLKKDNNLSEKAFQDAEATYRQNFLGVMAARQKIEAAWGKKIPEMLGEIVVPPGKPRKMNPDLDAVTKPGSLIRIDLPAGERLSEPQTARIVPLAKREQPVSASFLGELPVMDAQTQQQGLLFLNDKPNTADRLIPGEAVTAFIKSSDAPVKGVVIPASAILRHDGKGSVFVQTGENIFSRREISLDRAVDGGFFSAEFSATNRVVVTGAQTLLSAELSGGGFNAGQRD